MRITKRVLSVLLIAVMAIALSACGKEPQKDIIGKWEMDPAFMEKMLRFSGEFLENAKAKLGNTDCSGSIEFREDGILVLDMVHPAQIEIPSEDENAEPRYNYEMVTVHEEYPYYFKDNKLYINDQIVSYNLSNVNTLALNGNSRTLVVTKVKG